MLDDRGAVAAQGSAALDVQQPRPLWSEQDPEQWWHATRRAVAAAASQLVGGLRGLRAVGLAGQMHGATILDAADRPLRPAILWNDGRSLAQCAALERAVPESRRITGNLAMPGFTAPKIAWLREHEPEHHARLAKVLLPKDYLRLRLTGDFATDLSDASGTLWLDVAKRAWSNEMLAACGLSLAEVPTLFEGPEPTGRLRAEVANDWGCERVPVVAGAGDQAAGAIGAGVVEPGQASISLGTSGVYFVTGERFRPNPESAVHAFCHCLPGTWHQMSVLLSAASCLSWVCKLTGAADEAALLEELARDGRPSERLLFLPYLSGERTPHNDPHATGVFIGLDHATDRVALARAVLEGVAFAFADGQRALLEAGSRIETVSVIGGGARSPLWGAILASVLERPLVYRRGGELGAALGAARLAMLGVQHGSRESLCAPPPEDFVALPEPRLVEHARARGPRFRALYRALESSFADLPAHPSKAES